MRRNLSFTPTPILGVRIKPSRIARKGYMLNNEHYTTDGTNWWITSGDTEEPALNVKDLNNMAAIVSSDNSIVELVNEKDRIYRVRGVMYKRTGMSNFSKLSPEQEERENNRLSREKKLEDLAVGIKELSSPKPPLTDQDKSNLIEEVDEILSENSSFLAGENTQSYSNTTDKTPTQNTTVLDTSGDTDSGYTIYVNGGLCRKKNRQKNTKYSSNNINFVSLLMENRDVCDKLINTLNNKGMQISKPKDIIDVLSKSKYKVIMENISSVEDVNRLIDLIEKCGL